MFLVIADDLTGACELGGVALVHGLGAAVCLDRISGPAAGVTILDTDTRSRPPEEAARTIRALGKALTGFPQAEVFKKVDSVLRGPVLAELTALMQALGRSRVLLVPANPALGRTIRGGCYRIQGRPIHETAFRRDPEHPIRSSDVLEMLGAAKATEPVCLASPGAEPLPVGVVVGEAATPEEVAAWAERLDQETLPAGAADFFAALLEARGFPAHRQPPERRAAPAGTLLLVSGTGAPRARDRIAELAARGVPVLAMPDELTRGDSHSPELVSAWAARVIAALQAGSRAVVSIGRRLAAGGENAGRLLVPLARLTAEVLERFPVENLWVEGGATAGIVVRTAGWRRLEVDSQLAPGVVCVRPFPHGRPRIVMKPGSYPWPESL